MPDKVEGQDSPEFQAPEAESILNSFDDEQSEQRAPDGTKGNVRPQQDFNKLWDEHMKGEQAEALPGDESREESDDEIIDESDILKRHELEFENVDDLAEDYKQRRNQIKELGELLKKGGVDVSDNPVQDLIDMMEENLMQQQPGLLTGRPPQAAPTPEEKIPVAPAPQAPSPAGYQNTEIFTLRYPQLKWTQVFFKDLAGALQEHLPKQEAPKSPSADNYVSRQEVEQLAGFSKRLFRDQMVNDFIAERLSEGQKLPRNFRSRLTAEVEKNPTLVERALRGYLLRGRYDGVMQEYAKNLLAERDPSTGLSGAEADAQAEELKRAAVEKKSLKGGEPPSGGKRKREVTERELEAQIAAMAKELI